MVNQFLKNLKKIDFLDKLLFMFAIDNLTLNFHNNKTTLDSIPEDQEVNLPIMPFKLQTTSLTDITEMEDMGIFHPFDRLNWYPTIANFMAINEIDEDNEDNEDTFLYDPNNDISEFPNPLGQKVYFNQGDYMIENEELEICCLCSSLQEDSILLQIGEKIFLCTECFYQEKQKSQRENAEYERAFRQKVKNLQKYQFICPQTGKPLKINFKVHIPTNMEDDILIVQASKF